MTAGTVSSAARPTGREQPGTKRVDLAWRCVGEASTEPHAPASGRQPAGSLWRRLAAYSLLAACGLMSCLAGCAGYQIGNYSLYSPEIRTVAVPVFESDSFRRGLGERLTEAVIKRIELVTPYKVVQGPGADSTLMGRIVDETKRVTVGSRTGEPRELEVALRVEVSWVDHRGNLIRPRAYVPVPAELTDVSATGRVIPELGHSVATAHQQAIQRLAEQIVGLMETPW